MLNVIGQIKWLGAGVAAANFGAAIWDERGFNRAVSILFLLFAAVDMISVIVESAALVRVLCMLVVFSSGAVRLGVSRQNQN